MMEKGESAYAGRGLSLLRRIEKQKRTEQFSGNKSYSNFYSSVCWMREIKDLCCLLSLGKPLPTKSHACGAGRYCYYGNYQYAYLHITETGYGQFWCGGKLSRSFWHLIYYHPRCKMRTRFCNMYAAGLSERVTLLCTKRKIGNCFWGRVMWW